MAVQADSMMTAEQQCVVCAVLALARAGNLDESTVATIASDLAAYIAHAEVGL